jgi:hypothetical protein
MTKNEAVIVNQELPEDEDGERRLFLVAHFSISLPASNLATASFSSSERDLL